MLITFWARVTGVPRRLRWILAAWLVVLGGCLAAGFATGWSALGAIVTTGSALVVMVPPAVVAVDDAASPKPPIVRDSYNASVTPAPPDRSSSHRHFRETPPVALPGETRLELGQFPNPRWVVATCKWRVTGANDQFEIVRAILRRRVGWRWRSTEGGVRREDGFISASFAFYVPPGKPHREEQLRIRGTVTLIDSHNRHHRYPFKYESL